MPSSLSALRQALEVSPDNVPLLLLLAQSCLDEWLLDEAQHAYERALRLEPRHLDARLGLARTLHLAGKISEAIVRTEALLQEQPQSAAGWLLLSRLVLSEGSQDAARAHYRRARQLDAGLDDPALRRELYPPHGRVPAASSGRSDEEASGTAAHPAAGGGDGPGGSHGAAGGPPDGGSGAGPRVPLGAHDWQPADPDADGAPGGDPAGAELGADDDQEADDDQDDEESSGREDSPVRPPAGAEFERPTITFAEVGGMDVVKEAIRMKIIYPLRRAELFRAYGKKIGGGVLIYGPPGCGKTLLSRATAGEIQANFLSIGIHQILDLYLGNSEKNLHQLFQLAREHAPSVLFFDEVDALAADRNDLRRSAGRTLINQFLAELDGAVGSNDGLLVLGATNAPWHIDPAFRRPGRFDRILFVPPPDETARAAVIEILARGKPIARLDVRTLARRTADFSGADLKAVFDQTIERALTQAMREGRVVPLTTEELVRTAKSVKPSTRAWFESAKNYALYANQGGFYDDVLEFLGINKPSS